MPQTTESVTAETAAAGPTPVIVVGFSSKVEGRAALTRAVSEATLRGAELVVVHTSPDVEKSDLDAELAASGVPVPDHLGHRHPRPRGGADQHRRGASGRLHRDRPAPQVPGRQAAARQQRPAGPARCGLPGAGRQGRGRGQIALRGG